MARDKGSKGGRGAVGDSPCLEDSSRALHHGCKVTRQLCWTPASHSPLFVTCLRLGLGDEFLEARITPERIEHWVQPEQSRSERHVCGIKRAFVRCREQFLQGGDGAVGFSHPRRHSGKNLD